MIEIEEQAYCKCGGDIETALVGDECGYKCDACGRVWPEIEDWMMKKMERVFSPEQERIIEKLTNETEEM